MARTKQSARQSTGDLAPRCILGPLFHLSLHTRSDLLLPGNAKRKSRKTRRASTRDDDDYCPTASGKRKRQSGRDCQAEDMPVTKKRSNRTPVLPLHRCVLADVPTAPRTGSLHSKITNPLTAEPSADSEADAPPMIPSPSMISRVPRSPSRSLMLISSCKCGRISS